jgi:ribose/xylose/arabinose/galactoside ABC-type transport system permease subunit
MKGCLTFLTALIIGGVVAEQLYKISPKAAYAFVGVVLLGYASTGGNIDKVNSFFQAIYSQGTGG